MEVSIFYFQTKPHRGQAHQNQLYPNQWLRKWKYGTFPCEASYWNGNLQVTHELNDWSDEEVMTIYPVFKQISYKACGNQWLWAGQKEMLAGEVACEQKMEAKVLFNHFLESGGIK